MIKANEYSWLPYVFYGNKLRKIFIFFDLIFVQYVRAISIFHSVYIQCIYSVWSLQITPSARTELQCSMFCNTASVRKNICIQINFGYAKTVNNMLTSTLNYAVTICSCIWLRSERPQSVCKCFSKMFIFSSEKNIAKQFHLSCTRGHEYNFVVHSLV